MHIKKGNVVVHKANENKDLTVRDINGSNVVCDYFDKKTLKQVTYNTDEVMLSPHNEADQSFHINDEVELKSGGPVMIIISVNGEEVICAWNDGKANYKETFYEYELSNCKSAYDAIPEVLNKY